jgi:hypothetical protein
MTHPRSHSIWSITLFWPFICLIYYGLCERLEIICNVLEINTWPDHVVFEPSVPVKWTTHATGYASSTELAYKKKRRVPL